MMEARKKYIALIQLPKRKEPIEVPVFAASLEDALEQVDQEYGEDNVHRLRPEVIQ